MLKNFRIAVLISGGGTTLRNLIERRRHDQLEAEIALVISNNPAAKGLGFASDANLDHVTIGHREFDSTEAFSEAVFEQIRLAHADLVVMAGFLRRLTIPEDFTNRVINIHPSLIPAFSGKGHYGARVHQALLDYGCKVSGCTVHFVDDHYDHGPIIAQTPVSVEADDDASQLAARVFEAECELYPQVINAIAAGHVTVKGRHVTWNRPHA